ncbi:hypothetical protein ACFV5N_03790 [Streptomyces sp. NPDC059853]|uniref:hypothetical protein n=1 Tax=Streptomyces sp. NPDC059853 TaxID=3346973 RepID=UPI0036581154
MSTSPPPQLPGRVRTARTVSYAVAVITLLMAAISLQAGFGDEEALRELEMTAGPVIALGVIFLVYAAAGFALAARFAKGGAGVRIGGLVWGTAGIVLGFGTGMLGLLVLAASATVVVLLVMKDSQVWFSRAQK